MYKEFSKVYDYFMENAPYDEWYENIYMIFDKYNKQPNTILDLGCGTGMMSTMFALDNIEVTGIDISKEMLEEGIRKNEIHGVEVKYENQNIINFNMNKKYDCVMSTCDSYNYVLDDKDLLNSFKQVKKHLNKDSIFIFDVNTKYYYEETLGNKSYSEVAEDSTYIINNEFNDKTNINKYELTLFLLEENGLYKKVEETHIVKARSINLISTLIKSAKLDILEVIDTVTMETDEKSNRVYFICRGE